MIVFRDGRHPAVLRVQAVSSAESVTSRGWIVEFQQTVVVRRMSDNVAGIAVWCEGDAVVGMNKNYRFGAQWCKRYGIPVEVPLYFLVSRFCCVQS